MNDNINESDSILLWPHKALLTPCNPVLEFDELLHKNLDRLKATLAKYKNGSGLSSNQLGIMSNAFILKDKDGQIHEIINPMVREQTGSFTINEGCLSAPGVSIQVPRANEVTLEYQDRNGEVKLAVFTGLEAVVVQHEMEHLLGKFFTTKTNRQQRRNAERIMSKYK